MFIAVTGSDELNLLCCMFAKKAGHCHAIARVRNPSYSHELDFIKKQIGISAIINPVMAAAKEISHLLRFPGASKIDTFAGGRVRLIKFALTEQQGLDGVAIHEIPTQLKSDILVCAVERDGGVIIPNGNFVLQNGDQVTFLATQEKAHEFFQRIHLPVRPVRNAFIVGGGAIAFYLSQELLENHIRVRIVERDPARCNVLAESLPEAQILNEDGSNRDFLLSEGLESTEAFVALTNIDEENVLLTLFAKKHSKGKLVTKINRLEFDDILAGLDLGSIVYPKYMTCDYIVQYVRALQNEAGSNIKTLYRILDDRVEALEFTAFGRKPEVRADGRKCRVAEVARRSDGAVTYSAVLPRRAELPAEVSLTLTEERGYAGGAAIDGPVKLVCGVGRYTVGDWCRNDALRTYSGAAWYGRDFTLTKKPAGRVTLDLGEVVSTARVLVNGREAGLRLTPPWRFDVTGLLQEGANRIEIRVCNTTANIFLSSPTVYRGGTKAGILGPVRIEIAE